MIGELLQATFLIFMAEMGDKTQLLAMAFAVRYTVGQVLLGVMIGSFLNHGLAVLLGTLLAVVIPLDALRLAAAVIFLGFGLWTLATKEDEDDNQGDSSRYGPVMSVATAFFIGELGDKTQLAAITLATASEFPLVILIGTVTGMVLTSGVGIFIGLHLGSRIPTLGLKILSSLVFLFFGTLGLYQNLPPAYLTARNIFLYSVALGLVVVVLALVQRRHHHNRPLRRVAAALQQHFTALQTVLNELCRDPKQCKTCRGRDCPVGFCQEVIQTATRDKTPYTTRTGGRKPNRRFNRQKTADAIVSVVVACARCHNNHRADCALNRTREALERIYFGYPIPYDGDAAAYIKHVSRHDQRLAQRLRLALAGP